jgi:hypothetical protein
MTTNQDKIRWLKRYVSLGRRVDHTWQEIERLRAQIGKITPTLSLLPAGGGSIYKSHDHDTINRLVDLVGMMDTDLNKQMDARLEIDAVIKSVTDDRCQELLDYRYLQGQSFEWIASVMHYSWRHTHRIHSAALDMIDIGGNDAKKL